MNSQTNLEVTGNLQQHQLAELLVEILNAKLNGSLKLHNAQHKMIVYFDAGEVVFAVSNARQFRLFEFLLRENKITKEQLVAIPDFTNDLALNEYLAKNDLLPKNEIDVLFSRQLKAVLQDAFRWNDGEWIFSPLVRLKGDIRFKIDVSALLVEYARKLTDEQLQGKFKSLHEIFTAEATMPAHINLQPDEAFVLSRFENSSLSVERAKLFSGLTESVTLRVLYTLWLGGFITRQNWNSPFSDRRVSAILSANLTLKKQDAPVQSQTPLAQSITPTSIDTEEIKTIAKQEPAPVEESISLEEYLERTENAPNYYKMFAIAPDAQIAEIKKAYFMFAKRFHPDLFHQEVDLDKHKQIQNAFTKIAHAYETLKNENSRTVYDYKIRKELAQMNDSEPAGTTEEKNLQNQIEQARENFDRGFSLLMEENFEEALQFFARAAHIARDNARYHAYYGKLLSIDAKQKHKAEAELQTALKLDPNNAEIRLMLAEFFVQMKLFKRAEGELNRLLALFPGDKEAQALLDSLTKR